jgi:protein phosphatase
MGATLALLLIVDARAYAGNLGDSRIYRLRGGRLTVLSEDHSVVGELLATGEIGPEEAHSHCARGLLTQHVGMAEEARPYVRSFSLRPNDRFLLCTDGLTDMVDADGITQILIAHEDAQQAAETLVQTANDGGGLDNTTVAVVDWSP